MEWGSNNIGSKKDNLRVQQSFPVHQPPTEIANCLL